MQPGVLTASDFGFADVDIGDSLQQVMITDLPANGSLTLNGVAVTDDQVISKADIDAGLLAFAPDADASGAGYSSFNFKVHDGTAFSDAQYGMTFDVTAVADSPSLSVESPSDTISRQEFNTDFSSRNMGAEGWSGTNYQQYTVNGNYTHRLDNNQTISRTIDTSEGNDFVLTLKVYDGYATGDSTELQVIWNGQEIGTLSPTWNAQNQSITLPALGTDSGVLSLQTINGGSTYLDDIKLNQDLPNLVVDEDTSGTIDLAVALADLDGSETLTLTVSGVPAGAEITDGVNTVQSTGSDIDISGWNQDALSITPAADDNSDFDIVFSATSAEGSNSDTATTERTVVVTVNAVLDAPNFSRQCLAATTGG